MLSSSLNVDVRISFLFWLQVCSDSLSFSFEWCNSVYMTTRKPTYAFSSSLTPPTWRERCYSYHWTAQRSLPRVSSLLNMQHAASIRNSTVLGRNSCGRLQQGGRHPKRSQHSWPPLAFRCARLLWILLAARSKRCGKLSWFVHQNGRVQAVHFNSPIRVHWCYHGARTTEKLIGWESNVLSFGWFPALKLRTDAPQIR